MNNSIEIDTLVVSIYEDDTKFYHSSVYKKQDSSFYFQINGEESIKIFTNFLEVFNYLLEIKIINNSYYTLFKAD